MTAFAATGGIGARNPAARRGSVKQGNAICAGYNKQVRGLSQEFFPPVRSVKRPPPPSVSKFQAFLRRLVPLTEAELHKLRALKKPKADTATIDAIYAEVGKGLVTLRLAQTDHALARRLEGGTNPFAAANKKARAYGLTVCGGS